MKAKILLFVLAVLGIVGVSLLMGFPVKWCWNHAITHAFGAPEIQWGHAVCMMILVATFFAIERSEIGKRS